MCTAITFSDKDFYCGRNFDYSYSFGEEIIITPRNFTAREIQTPHYSIIGIGHNADNFPLYYDAVNEKGLWGAGLNFVGNAVYQSEQQGACNLPQYAFLPYLLAYCDSADDVCRKLKSIRLTDKPFSEKLSCASLHWIFADAHRCITVESVAEGLRVYPNPVGVLTNNPPFPLQLFSLNLYPTLSAEQPKNTFVSQITLPHYSRGLGALGLPGDFSSQSRFVRAVFLKQFAQKSQTEIQTVHQFFHILDNVAQINGCTAVKPNEYEYTMYSSCCNTTAGIYYYTTYYNRNIKSVSLNTFDLTKKDFMHLSIK